MRVWTSPDERKSSKPHGFGLFRIGNLTKNSLGSMETGEENKGLDSSFHG